MSLRLRLNLLVASLVAAFLLATAALVVDDARRSIREEIASGTRITVQLLSSVVYSGSFYPTTGTQREFLLSFLRSLGRVRAHDIALRDTLGNIVHQSPPSVYKAGRHAPEWFARLVLPRTEAVTLAIPGGTITVTPDPSRAVLDAWDDVKKLAAIAALLLAGAVPLVMMLVRRSLRPVERLATALVALERGALETRLPPMASPEFAATGERFNRMAEALESRTAENRRLALIAQQSSDAMLVEGADGRVTWANPAAERMIAPLAALAGRSLDTLPVGRAVVQALAKAGADTVENVECACTAADGRTLDVAVSAAPLVDAQGGERLGRIISLRDVTEHRRALEAERALEDSRRLTQLIQKHVEEERRHLARELHDELGQSVTAIRSIGTSIANRTRESAPEIHASSRMIVDVAARLYDGMHDIVRQLRPSALDHLGLREAVEGALASARAQHPEVAIALKAQGELDGLGEAVNIGAFRIVQECLTNALRHSGATRIDVALRRVGAADASRLELEVRDHGRGLAAAGPAAGPRFGILGVQERVQALGGTFAIEDVPGGSGTRALAVVPLVSAGVPSPIRT